MVEKIKKIYVIMINSLAKNFPNLARYLFTESGFLYITVPTFLTLCILLIGCFSGILLTIYGYYMTLVLPWCIFFCILSTILIIPFSYFFSLFLVSIGWKIWIHKCRESWKIQALLQQKELPVKEDDLKRFYITTETDFWWQIKKILCIGEDIVFPILDKKQRERCRNLYYKTFPKQHKNAFDIKIDELCHGSEYNYQFSKTFFEL